MTSQKIPLPLLGGQIYPIHAAAGDGYVTTLFTPPDANLDEPPSTYEVHLWLMPALADDTSQEFHLHAKDNDTDERALIWGASDAAVASVYNWPARKILDGYPMRGNVSLEITAIAPADLYPVGPQVFGYYQRIGSGHVYSPERRFIGQALEDFKSGMPIVIAAAGSEIVHTFSPGRIDDIALALSAITTGPVLVTFEDASNNPVIPTHGVVLPARLIADLLSGAAQAPEGFNPASPYVIKDVPFGGVNPALHHIRIAVTNETSAHGYFVRH